MAKIRASKVVKEFNIALSTLVEFLHKKGIEIESNPGAVLSEDAYALVEKEFAKEHLLKEQSRKVAISVKEITESEHAKAPAEEPEEVIIKTNVLDGKPFAAKSAPAPAPKPEPEPEKPAPEPEEPAPEVEKPQMQVLNVLDKIDLDALNKPRKVEKPAPEVVEPVVEEKPAPEPVAVKKEEEEAPAPVEKPVIEHIETKVEKLKGPAILGKINLEETKPAPKEKQRDKNKKRERIHKQTTKVDINQSASFGKDADRNRRGKKGQRDAMAGKFVRPETDEDEVQRQIKETYARLTESRSKTKGSKHRREKREIFEAKQEEAMQQEMLTSKILKVTEFVTVNELAIMMNNTPVTKVIEACMNLGQMVSINQRLEADALVLVAEEFGYKIEFTTAGEQEALEQEEDRPEDLVPRPPIITVMGHVDHGKTSLLDYIRKSNVIAGEAGGITQHIGAYNVKLPDGRHITFLDTPGHEAFTAMRARGAKLTDIAIIIIAADDAVMPQTIEAINHAQAAGVPMVFAINKIDKPGASGEKIREQLANMNILVEDWGGKYQCQEISAKTGINVDKLLDKVLLEADMLDLKANPNKRAVGSVVESSLDKGRGYLATVLVQSGTLHVGDVVLAGCYTGRVKAMFNERGQKITEAGPSTPVSVLGLNGAPTAGDTINVLEDEKEAKEIANKREQLLRMQGLRAQQHVTLEEIGRRIAIGNFKELNIIVKADVDGSIEALSDSLIKLSTEEVKVNVIHKAVGAISESDVLLAVASNAIIIGFQVRPSADARRQA
ncbi:MAG: translation initiation factor IF-2, partial [Bacteroidales bacterium]|nr:translation initiation factor IF-2 [Bacteroidales bacterium]